MKESKIEKLILDLSNRWECSPQEAVDRLNSMNESEINKLIEDMVKKFNNGGFIDCLRNGGTIPACKCGKKISPEKAFSGTKLFGTTLNSYTPEQIRAIKNGTYRHSYIDDQGNQHTVRPWSKVMQAPGNSFGLARQVITPQGKTLYRSQGYEVEKDGTVVPFGGSEGTQWYEDGGHKDAFENSKHFYPTMRETIKSVPPMMQEGGLIEDEGPVAGRIPRSSMFDAAREFMPGVDRKFVRQAYRAAKRQGRAAGNTGTYLRQDARDRVIEKFRNYADSSPVNMPPLPTLYDNIDIEIADDPILNNDEFFTPLDSSIIPTVQKIDRFGGSFNSAFAAARRSGLDKFYWTDPTGENSGWKTTKLGKNTPSAQQQEYSYNQQLVENAVESPKTSDKIKAGILSTLNYPMK